MKKNATLINITLGATLILLVCGVHLVARGQSTSPTMPAHPRLLVTHDEIPLLKQRFDHPDFKEIRKELAKQRNYNTTGIVTSDRPNEAIRQKAEALALDYLLDSAANKTQGLEAVRITINYLKSYSELRTTVQKDYADNLQTYEAVFGAALVYDWCYPLLGAQDKVQLIDLMKKVCTLGEYGLPPIKNNQYLSGHYGEYAPTIFLAMGVAVYDEDTTMFNYAYNEQIKGFAPSRNPMYPASTHHQGAQYIHVRGYHEMMQHFILNKLGISPYHSDISNMTYRVIYGTTPQKTDMDGMPEGDCHNNLMMGNSQIYYLSANLSHDPYLQTMSRKYLSLAKHQSARLFILHNPDIKSADVEQLPLSRYFASPSGMMIARTAWDIDSVGYGSNAMVVMMNMKEYNAQNHTHMDEGHFSIYYKGHLALDAGIYQGKDAGNGWGKVNYVNYYSRTIAHNSVLIYDPEEPTPYAGWKIKSTARDGGQFFFAHHAWDNSKDMFAGGKSAEMLAVDIAPGQQPDYSYMKADMTRAYCVPPYVGVYPPKVDTVRRSFVFLNHKGGNVPGTLIVMDRIVSTRPEFKKTWLLHTQNEPTIKDGVVVAENTNKGRNGRNGRMITTVLMPEGKNQEITTIGGPGKEYWVDGQNWGTVTQEDAGRWRIEISPKSKVQADNFLNVIQVTDANGKEAVDKVSKVLSLGGHYVAVMVANRIVAQSLHLDANQLRITFTMGNKKQMYKVLLTDLKPGMWNVNTPSGKQTIRVDQQGTAYFESAGGKFDLTFAQ